MSTLLKSICFGFEDRAMERSYQEYRVSTLYDQIGPIIVYFWIPVDVILHLATISYRNYFSLQLSSDEIFIFWIRIVLLLLSVCLFLISWNSGTKKMIGSCVEWMTRGFFLVIANEQSHALHDDLFSTTTLMYMLSMSGIKTPTYFEYIFASMVIVSIRPFLVSQRMSDPKMEQLFWQAAYQNILLFSFGAGISWKFQSERREKWLHSPKAASYLQPTTKTPQTRKATSGSANISKITAEVLFQCSIPFPTSLFLSTLQSFIGPFTRLR